MKNIEITKQLLQKVNINKMILFFLFYLFTNWFFLNKFKQFNRMNNFITIKFVNLETNKSHKNKTYILKKLKITFINNVANQIIQFQIRICLSKKYKILIFLYEKNYKKKKRTYKMFFFIFLFIYALYYLFKFTIINSSTK